MDQARVFLMVGPSVPVPMPPHLMDLLDRVEVQQGTDRSGFQLTFQAGRSGPVDVTGAAAVRDPLLKPWNRVVVSVLVGAQMEVLVDGFITNLQYQPGGGP